MLGGEVCYNLWVLTIELALDLHYFDASVCVNEILSTEIEY